jgi:hypothetical protein
MTQKQLNKLIENLEKAEKKVSSSKKAASEFLQRAGIVDKHGQLTKPYR